ncbi:MAG: FlgO family outer membrane protein [Thermoanaerobaculia bacterium]
MQLLPGDRVAQYEILRPVGVGGMGEVYCARDAKLGREVALKILPSDLASNPDALRRFEQEARAASALNHPNIVTIYEISRSETFAWIAMELVDGEDLRTIATREALSLKNALRIATRVADGLAAAHDRGIVHRDLKPDNVMVTPEGFVKILDFGLAKQIRTLASDDTTLPQTSPGTIFGTVGYMSPEQATGREMDARSDQFSFGVMLYELLTRVRPFEKGSKTETLASILRDEPLPPSAVNETIPPDLDRIVSRCLAKDPRDRYASTRDLARDLREVRDSFSHSSVERRAVSESLRRRRRSPVAWAIAAVAVIAIAAGFVMWKRRDAARKVTSIAVVPFRDLGGTKDGRVFADGISEMIATRLAQVRELRVASPFDGAPIAEGADLREIAKRTGAHAVVRGTVQRGGGDVRVTVALVDARDGRTLAASTATRASTDLFALQDAVANDLLRALGRAAPPRPQVAQVVLGSDDQRRFTEAVGLLQRARDEEAMDQAIASLESILRNARESGSVNAMLARALLFKSVLARRPTLVEQATVYATRGVALSANDPDAHTTLGDLQNASGRHAEAVLSFQRALALRPDDPSALVGLAVAYDRQGRPVEAEAMYRKVLSIRPDSPGALVRYGVFCQRRSRFADAAAHFRRATELDPEFVSAHGNLGAALLQLGKHDEALVSLQKSLSLSPTPTGYSNVGTLQFRLGRYDDARQSYEKAVGLAPGDCVLWANLGDACRWVPGQSGRAKEAYDQAASAARAALEINPNDALTHSVLAFSLAHGGALEEAQREIRRALEIDPTNTSVLYKAAVIALLRGSTEGAVSWIERAVANGYPARELASDPDLKALYELPSFRNAVQSKG